jgi:hypothetical protein
MKKQEECLELKNIQYQTMLLGGKAKTNSSVENTINIEDYLERERNANKKKPWNKLSMTSKLIKIKLFVTDYSKKHKLVNDKSNDMLVYLQSCLSRKKLQKMKDVEYDVEKGVIKNIPNLHFNKNNNKFTLKNNKISILKNLAPKTRKKKNKEKRIKERKRKSNKSKQKNKTPNKSQNKKVKKHKDKKHNDKKHKDKQHNDKKSKKENN